MLQIILVWADDWHTAGNIVRDGRLERLNDITPNSANLAIDKVVILESIKLIIL